MKVEMGRERGEAGLSGGKVGSAMILFLFTVCKAVCLPSGQLVSTFFPDLPFCFCFYFSPQ